jgi:AcrR family transcriptional regulator
VLSTSALDRMQWQASALAYAAVPAADVGGKRTFDTYTDVCDRANIGRSTLYLHFADKEDLLFSGFEDLEATLEQARAAAPGQFAFARGLIAHAQSELPMFRALAARRPGRHVVAHLRGVSVHLVSAELEYLKVSRSQRALLAPYIAGALVEHLVGWLERPTRQSADELASGFIALTRAACEKPSDEEAPNSSPRSEFRARTVRAASLTDDSGCGVS